MFSIFRFHFSSPLCILCGVRVCHISAIRVYAALLIQSQMLWKPNVKWKHTPTHNCSLYYYGPYESKHGSHLWVNESDWKQAHQSRKSNKQNITWEFVSCSDGLCACVVCEWKREKSEEKNTRFHCENLQLSVNFINIFGFSRFWKKLKYFRNFIHDSLSGNKHTDIQTFTFVDSWKKYLSLTQK